VPDYNAILLEGMTVAIVVGAASGLGRSRPSVAIRERDIPVELVI
jgi:hypothetical protein